uniref:Hydroxysteroid 11-beta dehydrogenase 1 like n=1 Tax=Crocodylus porosus TaxID=8502 RepID=A0A7M4EZ63_CROPO
MDPDFVLFPHGAEVNGAGTGLSPEASVLALSSTAAGEMSARWKALWAAGIATGLLAFFWRDTFNPETISSAHMLLTGASAGIGEQMAYHYSRFGTEIVLTARREAVLQKKCLQLGTKKVFYIPADMSCPAEPERVMQFAVQKIGGLDYLVLNHIGGTPFQMWDGDVQHTRWLLQVVNAASAMAVLLVLMESKGSVVVVSSVSGKIATPFTTSCSATRLALDGFFSFLRHELATQKKDVSITLCVLGLIDTETALEKMRRVMEDICGGAGHAAQLFWASPVIPESAQHLHKLDYVPPKQIHAGKISSEPGCATSRPIGNVQMSPLPDPPGRGTVLDLNYTLM